MGDDEFDDDGIDWDAVELPPASNVPNHNNASHNQIQTRQNHSSTGVHNANNNNTMYSAPTQPPITGTYEHNTSTNSTTQSLQQQIAHLQNLLSSKDSRINELEASTAAAAASRNAEQEARARIHLVEEELRRAKREADQYRGQWVRVKKRVAELEQGDGGRAITPSNVDHFHNHFKDDVKSDVKMDEERGGKGVKRKSEENALFDRNKNGERQSTVHSLVIPPAARHESVTENIAKHLMLLDEMGLYSLNGTEEGQSDDGKTEPDIQDAVDEPLDQNNSVTKSSRDPLEQETQSFVKSILCHMVTDPSASDTSPIHHSLPVSGLVRILLKRLNTLFYDCSFEKESADMDVDHFDDRVKDCGLTLTITLNGKQVKHAAYSWRAVLYLLHVIRDTLILSAKAREDLRWWFYRARQRDDSDDVEMSYQDATAEGTAHPRIEGLPSNISLTSNSDRKEAFWNNRCRSCSNPDNGWNATSMHSACNTFYEILVGLMVGVQSTSKDNTSHLDGEKILQYAQIKSIELVSCLMSDATPYDHVESNPRNKTPHLWKFWFDSLFPAFSTIEAPSNSLDMVDFFSIWEKDGCSYRKSLLGSGRRYYTQNEAVPTKQIGGKQSSKGDKAKLATVSAQTKDRERLAMNIKCKSLQLLSHFISSSSSLQQSIFQVRNQTKSAAEGVSLAKRILFAILDELDEFAIPFLSSRVTEKDQRDFDHCLDMCVSAMMFLLMLSRSDAGIHLLRVQIKLDFEIGGIYRWSSSAIGCVTAMMDGILLRIADYYEGKESLVNANRIALLNVIVQQCISFYKNILSFVHNQSNDRPKAKVAPLKAIIADHHGTTFVSCCHRIMDQKALSDELKYEARVLLEEFVLDGE